MQQFIKFNMELPAECFERIKDKASYNNDYYNLKSYGDWLYGKCNVLRQTYHECENCYTNTLGYFESDDFVEMVNWTTSEDILEG